MLEEITGKRFNEIYEYHTFCKFTNKKSKHYEFQYRPGLNIDNISFQANRECSAGGLYFTSFQWDYTSWIPDNKWVWDVTIPDDARVVVESNGKAKANKFILSNKRKISRLFDNITDDDAIAIFHAGQSCLFRYMKRVSEKVILKAIQLDPWNTKYVKHPTMKMLLEVVNLYHYLVDDIMIYAKNPNEFLMRSINLDREIYHYITNPSQKITDLYNSLC